VPASNGGEGEVRATTLEKDGIAKTHFSQSIHQYLSCRGERDGKKGAARQPLQKRDGLSSFQRGGKNDFLYLHSHHPKANIALGGGERKKKGRGVLRMVRGKKKKRSTARLTLARKEPAFRPVSDNVGLGEKRNLSKTGKKKKGQRWTAVEIRLIISPKGIYGPHHYRTKGRKQEQQEWCGSRKEKEKTATCRL